MSTTADVSSPCNRLVGEKNTGEVEDYGPVPESEIVPPIPEVATFVLIGLGMIVLVGAFAGIRMYRRQRTISIAA